MRHACTEDFMPARKTQNHLLTFLSIDFRHIGALFCILVLSSLFAGPAPGSAEMTITLTISGIEGEQTHQIAREIIEEAYARIGISVTFLFVPGKRSLMMANNGRVDGDLARILGTETVYENLLPVPTRVLDFSAVAFTKRADITVNNWQELQGYRVGIIRGIRYSEIGTRGMNPRYADNMQHLFQLLDQGRVDVAIATIRAGMSEIAVHYPQGEIHQAGDVLHTEPLHHFLHRKHKEIIPLLDNALNEMTQTGIIRKIAEETFQTRLAPKEADNP